MSIQSSFNTMVGAAGLALGKNKKKMFSVGETHSSTKGDEASKQAKKQSKAKKQQKTAFQKRLANIKVKKQSKASRATLKAVGGK